MTNTSSAMPDARAINTAHFEAEWSSFNVLKQRFRYNLEVTRKDFLHAARTIGLSMENQRVLDVGFGSGMLMFLFARSSSLHGTEFSEAARAAALRRANARGYARADFRIPEDPGILPYPSNEFTVVIASHVVEHVTNDRQLLREMLRVLRPGGHLILILPLDATTDELLSEEELINPAHVTQGHFHVRNYNLTSLMQRCKSAEGQIVFHQADCQAWEWKQKVEHMGLVRGLMQKGFSIVFNLVLSLVPRSVLSRFDEHLSRRGYRARQAVVAIRKI